MSDKVSIDAMSSTIQQLLKQYGDEVQKTANELIPDAADKAVDQIRSKSKKRTGKYAKGWSKKVLKNTRTGVGYVVYNRTEYRVAHLLENSHIVKNKYGTYGTTAGDGVIAQAEDDTLEWIDTELRKRLEGE